MVHATLTSALWARCGEMPGSWRGGLNANVRRAVTEILLGIVAAWLAIVVGRRKRAQQSQGPEYGKRDSR
jgi:hypothetical protein